MNKPTPSSLIEELQDHLTRTRALITPLTADQRSWKPSAKSWSIHEVLDHLCVTGSQYYPRIQNHIRELPALAQQENEPIRTGLNAGLIVKYMAPNGKPVPAPRKFRPKAGTHDPDTLDRYFSQQEEFAQILNSLSGIPINKGKFKGPVLGFIARFTAGEGCLIMVRHQQRHYAQFQRIIQQGETSQWKS